MFKVDDSFYEHPKVKRIPRGAVRKGAITLWTFAGSWCDRFGTDGLVPEEQVLDLGATLREGEALVTAGLWHRPGHGCRSCPDVPPQHYLFHEWATCNELKVDAEKRKKKARERMRRLRTGESHATEPDGSVRDLFARTNGERAPNV
jgi:hypothetical protein